MNHARFAVGALLLLASTALPAQAQDAPAPSTIAPGAYMKTSDGKRLGQVFSVDKDSSGAIVGVALIGSYSTLVHVPIATISAVDKSHFTTSLTYDQITHRS